MTQPNQPAQPPAIPLEGTSTTATAPTEAPAQGAAPTVDVKAIAAEVRDSLFAELRRSGMLGKEKSAPAKLVEASPQADLGKLRALDRAVSRSPHASRLSDAAHARLERAFVDEAPEDPAVWLADYFAGFGLGATTQPAAQAATTDAQPRTAIPISSGGGSPPVPAAPLEERDILSLSEADRNHLIAQKGVKWYLAKFAEQSKGKSVRLR